MRIDQQAGLKQTLSNPSPRYSMFLSEAASTYDTAGGNMSVTMYSTFEERM